jgi:hypothetical protein
MNENIPDQIGLTERELCEAISTWLKRMGRPLIATSFAGSGISGRGSFDFKVERMTEESQHYEKETSAEVLRLLRLRKTIEAIKYYRGRTGSGLREAKDHVDRIMRDNGFFH